jgi:hypothetical protein
MTTAVVNLKFAFAEFLPHFLFAQSKIAETGLTSAFPGISKSYAFGKPAIYQDLERYAIGRQSNNPGGPI